MELPGGKKGGGKGVDKKPAAKAPPPAAEAPHKSSAPPRKTQSAASKVYSDKCTYKKKYSELKIGN